MSSDQPPLTKQIDTEGGLHLSEERATILVERIERDLQEKNKIIEEYQELETDVENLRREYERYRDRMQAKVLLVGAACLTLGAAFTWVIQHAA